MAIRLITADYMKSLFVLGYAYNLIKQADVNKNFLFDINGLTKPNVSVFEGHTLFTVRKKQTTGQLHDQEKKSTAINAGKCIFSISLDRSSRENFISHRSLRT